MSMQAYHDVGLEIAWIGCRNASHTGRGLLTFGRVDDMSYCRSGILSLFPGLCYAKDL
jgi:hypothetical protein